ncbi:MAG: tryptophan synthase subunit alpha [Candidatus Dormibacteria bacterium]
MTAPAGEARLAQVFSRARAEGRAALIGYLVAGDPDLAGGPSLVHRLAAAGLDLLELGIPFSDPLADGPEIAAASQRALGRGVTVEDSLALAARAAEALPVMLFTYLNPVLRYGLERFAAAAAAAGISGVIICDLTLEEAAEANQALAPRGLGLTLLVSPTTGPERAARIAAESRGFLYVVSRLGVTGALKGPDLEQLRGRLVELRRRTQLPLAVGFGISNEAQAAQVAALADAVVVGSGLVRACSQAGPADAASAGVAYLSPLRNALSRSPVSPGAPR